jgi:hypothetical protein
MLVCREHQQRPQQLVVSMTSLSVSDPSDHRLIAFINECQQIWNSRYLYLTVDKTKSLQINRFISPPSDLSLSLVQHSNQSTTTRQRTSYHRRRVLPLLAYWTIACEFFASISSRIPRHLVCEMIEFIQMSNGRSLPLPLWLHERLNRESSVADVEKKIMPYGIRYRTAFAFLHFSWHQPYHRLGLALFRYTCPILHDGGPILAYQRRRRLPDRSLVTLIISRTYDHTRDLWASKWKDGSILPQRAIVTNDNGETHVIGILHQLLNIISRPRAPNLILRPLDGDTEANVAELEQSMRLASVLIPHCHYLDTPMIHTPWHSGMRLPMEIVAFQGHKELMEQLLLAGATPLSSSFMHDNEIKLRQLLRHENKLEYLPWKRMNDFEIIPTSEHTIHQGAHSRVYKAFEIAKGTRFNEFAVKIILLTPTTTIETIANEIMVVNRRLSGSVNCLLGLSANEIDVRIITPFAQGGTLEDLLPTLREVKHLIFNNNIYDSLTIDQRRIKYLHHIHPIVEGLFERLIDQYQSHKILHRDLRSSNITLDNKDVSVMTSNDVHIIDYGHATREGLSLTLNEAKQKNDPYFYGAPEVLDGSEYTFSSEMWSFGMILLSLWTCNKPFSTEVLNDSMVSS